MLQAMLKSSALAKLLLGVFVLNAPLCPGPANAAAGGPAGDSYHGGHAAVDDAMADCHGDATRDDCDMGSEADPVGFNPERSNDTAEIAIGGGRHAHDADVPHFTTAARAADHSAPPEDNPVSRHDCMLD